MTATNGISSLEKIYGREGLDQDGAKIITLAPDVEGVLDCIDNLTARGVTVSIGHSDATLEVAIKAVEKGAKMITHLFKYVKHQ
jgi:N-acetylglucosamine-6-phosphate deacetylase